MFGGQIKKQFEEYEAQMVEKLNLGSVDGKDHLVYQVDIIPTRHRKYMPNIIDTLKPATFVEGMFGGKAITLLRDDNSEETNYVQRLIEFANQEKNNHAVVAEQRNSISEENERPSVDTQRPTSVARMPTSIDKTEVSELANANQQPAALKVLLDIAACLSPLVIKSEDDAIFVAAKKKCNYWREDFKNELANNTEFAKYMATLLAKIPAQELKDAKFPENIEGTPFQFMVNLKRSLGARKERSFGEALAFVKVDVNEPKCDDSALDAVMNAYRTSSLISVLGLKTHTLKRAVEEDQKLITDERPSIFQKK